MINWDLISNSKIVAISAPGCDRSFLLTSISNYFWEQKVYFWNKGYKNLKLLVQGKILPTEIEIKTDESIIDYANSLTGVLVIQGIGRIATQSDLAYQLENFYFEPKNISLILLDNLISIPANLYPLIQQIQVVIPNVVEIKEFLIEREIEVEGQRLDELAVSFLGLSRGEIDILLKQQLKAEEIIAYKTEKLAKFGLRITPTPDVSEVGGLDLLLRDLNKIKKLFSPTAANLGLRPPKGCLLWGLPGTGKSLVAKMLSSHLGATLISCDWNQLVSSNLAESLQNLQLVLRLVDNSGACVLFFDEFEKAFFGWNSSDGGGVLAKMAGQLLSWLQDHTSPSIMVATINRLDMLPPELVRRFEYIWFFDSKLHNGAMYEIFKLHLAKYFDKLHDQFSDEDWFKIFREYRLCSPAEIATAIKRVADEIFFLDLHQSLTTQILLEHLVTERSNFKPAMEDKVISDALAEISQNADFARPVRGKLRSCTSSEKNQNQVHLTRV